MKELNFSSIVDERIAYFLIFYYKCVLLNFSLVEIRRKIERDRKLRYKDTGNEISKRSTLRGREASKSNL